VEKGIQRQREANPLDHFNVMGDYQSWVGIHFALGDFKSCLHFLNILNDSDWGQCTKARCYLGLGRRKEALNSLVRVKRCSTSLRLKSNILGDIAYNKDLRMDPYIKALQMDLYIKALQMNRAAYQGETRPKEKIALQKEMLLTILLAKTTFPPKLRELTLWYVI